MNEKGIAFFNLVVGGFVVASLWHILTHPINGPIGECPYCGDKDIPVDSRLNICENCRQYIASKLPA